MKKHIYYFLTILFICLAIVTPAALSETYGAQEQTDTSALYVDTDEFLVLFEGIYGMTYQEGSSGMGVAEIQKLLCSSGYLPEDKVDGLYGPITAFAVMGFQSAAGLEVTGKADLATQFMLLMADTSFVQQNSLYIAQVENYAMIIWPEEAFYIGALDQAGDFAEGTYYFTTGNYYVGEFKDNLRSGKGMAIFMNGDVYVGEWKNDAMNGQGTYYYGGIESNEYYKGNMVNNAMDGQGTYYLDGMIISGQWSNNQFVE